jgi:hypothetical protein
MLTDLEKLKADDPRWPCVLCLLIWKALLVLALLKFGAP